MADVVANIAKGRIVELYNRVKGNDPSTSAFILMALETTGLEADSVLMDKDDFAALVSGATNEQTTVGRKTLTDADLAALPAPDDANNRYDIDLPDVTWTAATGNQISKIALGYDANTGTGTDADILFLGAFDCGWIPDGTDFTMQFDAAGFFRAS